MSLRKPMDRTEDIEDEDQVEYETATVLGEVPTPEKDHKVKGSGAHGGQQAVAYWGKAVVDEPRVIPGGPVATVETGVFGTGGDGGVFHIRLGPEHPMAPFDWFFFEDISITGKSIHVQKQRERTEFRQSGKRMLLQKRGTITVNKVFRPEDLGGKHRDLPETYRVGKPVLQGPADGTEIDVEENAANGEAPLEADEGILGQPEPLDANMNVVDHPEGEARGEEAAEEITPQLMESAEPQALPEVQEGGGGEETPERRLVTAMVFFPADYEAAARRNLDQWGAQVGTVQGVEGGWLVGIDIPQELVDPFCAWFDAVTEQSNQARIEVGIDRPRFLAVVEKHAREEGNRAGDAGAGREIGSDEDRRDRGGRETEDVDLVFVFVTKEEDRRGARPAFESAPKIYQGVCEICGEEFTASGSGAWQRTTCDKPACKWAHQRSLKKHLSSGPFSRAGALDIKGPFGTPMSLPDRECRYCGRVFAPNANGDNYCSTTCEEAAKRHPASCSQADEENEPDVDQFFRELLGNDD
jgi:hypothetical protein